MNETMMQIFNYRASSHPDRTALVFEDIIFNYREMHVWAHDTANFLKEKGVGPGDRFSVISCNTPFTLSLWTGAAIIGAVPVYINRDFSAAEMNFILQDSRSKLLIYSGDFEDTVKELNTGEIITCKIEDLSFSIDFDENIEIISSESGSEDILIQLYTSGSDEFPEGVLLSNKSMLSMVHSLQLELPGFAADSINLVIEPFFSIAGAGSFLLGLYTGAVNVILDDADPDEILRTIEENGVTNVFLSSGMIQKILLSDITEKYNLTSLRNIHYSGPPMMESLLKEAYATFKCHFTHGFGLTETSGIFTLLRFDEHIQAILSEVGGKYKKRFQSSGKPLIGMKVKIINDEGEEMPPDEPGEVIIKGENMSKGYWNSKKEFLDTDGWFHSGNKGKVDEDGFLYLLDRKKKIAAH